MIFNSINVQCSGMRSAWLPMGLQCDETGSISMNLIWNYIFFNLKKTRKHINHQTIWFCSFCNGARDKRTNFKHFASPSPINDHQYEFQLNTQLDLNFWNSWMEFFFRYSFSWNEEGERGRGIAVAENRRMNIIIKTNDLFYVEKFDPNNDAQCAALKRWLMINENHIVWLFPVLFSCSIVGHIQNEQNNLIINTTRREPNEVPGTVFGNKIHRKERGLGIWINDDKWLETRRKKTKKIYCRNNIDKFLVIILFQLSYGAFLLILDQKKYWRTVRKCGRFIFVPSKHKIKQKQIFVIPNTF